MDDLVAAASVLAMEVDSDAQDAMEQEDLAGARDGDLLFILQSSLEESAVRPTWQQADVTNKLVVTVTRLVSLSSFRARFSTTITTTAILMMSTVRKTRSGSQYLVYVTEIRYFWATSHRPECSKRME